MMSDLSATPIIDSQKFLKNLDYQMLYLFSLWIFGLHVGIANKQMSPDEKK